MTTQKTAAPKQRPIIPQVRYHPSMLTAGNGISDPMTMQKTAAPNQRPDIPQVCYHPSIRTAGNRISEAESNQRSTASAPPRPQSKTQPKPLKMNQDSGRTRPADKEPESAGDQASRKPTPRNRTDAARHPHSRTEPKQALENGGPSKTRPVSKPNLNGGPVPKRDLGSAGDQDPPTPDQVPLDLRANLNETLLQQVEVLTRGQSTNQAWFDWRKNRITASVAHRIAHSKFVNGESRAPPTSYLAAVTGEGPKVQTRAMSWGIQKEAEVVRKYEKWKRRALGRPVKVRDCGLFIDSERPWLAASPDGIVVDEIGNNLLCLEVKCPFKHKDRTVEDACRGDPAFCLQLQEDDRQMPGEPPVYVLKTSHCYYTQIQVQLAVTGLQQADLVVFTLKEMAIVPVEFDPQLWDETVSKLEFFYRDAVLPHVRQKLQQNAAAATRPEL